MKFLFAAHRFHTNLYYRAKVLRDAEHEVKVVVLYKGKSEFYKNIHIQQVNLSSFSKALIKIIYFFKKTHLKSNLELRLQSPGKEFKQILKSYKPDVILLKAYQNALALKTLIIAKKYGIKVLMLTQTPYDHIKSSKFLFKLNIKLFRFLKVYAYITPIKINYEVFRNAGIKNVYYLPFVFPPQKINFEQKNKDVIKILSVGKFQKRKDQMLLLKVFSQLSKESYNIKLCLIGEVANSKYIKSLQNFIEENQLSEDVCIKTNMPYDKITGEYKKYDVFVLPAYNEPAAYSPVEAFANGLPVICSDDNGTKCYIEEGKNGYIFEAKNMNDLKEKIKLLISEKETLREMQKNALYSAKENHNPEDFADKILRILSK